jgi:hypothetical protein
LNVGLSEERAAGKDLPFSVAFRAISAASGAISIAPLRAAPAPIISGNDRVRLRT